MKKKGIAIVEFEVEGIKVDSFSSIGKTYNFNSYEDLKEGDVVLVDTANGARLATVVCITNTSSNEAEKATKDVICKVDVNPFIEREKAKQKKKELKKELDKKIKELEIEQFYRKMAESYPELKEMVEDYKRL